MSEQKHGIGLKERMLSAVAGSLLTSLFLTPMDVVRVRLQQQEMLPNCSCEVEGVVSTELTQANKVFWQDPCFQDVQCKGSTVRFNSTWDAFGKIAKMEGVTSLWRGISLTVLMAAPSNVVYFAGYESLRDWSPLRTTYPTFNPLLCGAFARVMAATTVAPLELMRTRLQSIPRSSRSTTTIMMIKDLIKESRIELSRDGYRALFKGLEITLWRDVPFSALYWATYEFYKSRFWFHSSITTRTSTHWDQFINSFLGGSISGSVAAILTHPFDVGKTRMQISAINASNKARKQNTTLQESKIGMFRFLKEISKNEGISALYTGLVPRVMKVAPSCAIMISTYEVSKKYFSS